MEGYSADSHMVSGHMDHGIAMGGGGLASVKARREPRGLVRHDIERRQTPIRIKTVVL
jgi:hypothetical protein